jgi:hypothetical protein
MPKAAGFRFCLYFALSDAGFIDFIGEVPGIQQPCP